jgi:hypothetical protein
MIDQVEEHVPFTTARYKVFTFQLHSPILLTWLQTIPCYLALFALAEIFELIMAFDALRLRNIIQLIGILSEQRSHTIMSLVTERYNPSLPRCAHRHGCSASSSDSHRYGAAGRL